MLFARSNRYNVVSPFLGIVLDFASEFLASFSGIKRLVRFVIHWCDAYKGNYLQRQ